MGGIFRRGRHARHRRGRTALVVGACFALLSITANAFADGGSLDVEVADTFGYANETTDDDAIVEYIGSNHTDFGSSGSGVFEAFLRTHASPSETGYNTDNSPFEFDEVGGAFTHSILVSEIPVVECESVDGNISNTGLCWELFADINDSNSTPLIQLTDLELYFTGDPEITGYPFGGTATKVYDFEGDVKINDVNPGSGRGDLRYLVPLDGITLPGDCDYGSSTCETYFVLYTGWGDPAGGEYSSDAGFNEWKVKRYPFLSVSKTANTTFTRTFAWTIDKSVNPEAWDLFDGDSGTSDWTVAVTKDEGTDSNWAVSGTITIDNPSDQDAVIESVEDAISGVGAATVDCGVGVTFPYELDEGETLECSYSSTLPDGANRTNTATATLESSQVFMGDADVIFGDPTTLVNDTVDVTDTNGMSWDDIADDDSFTYPETFECDADEGTHTNTATITQTGQSDDATVTVTCYDLEVTKTAVPSFNRDFDWTIEKTVDPDSLDLFDGDSDSVEWTVTWTKGAAEDFGYAVEGEITIANNHPTLAADLTAVTDSISGIGAVAVDCPSLTVPAGGSLVCTYESDLPDGTTRTNTATATQQNYGYASDLTATESGTTDYSDDADVDFTGVNPTVTDDTATITDDRGPLNLPGTSGSGSTSYTEGFTCGEDEGTHGNTAIVTETDSGDFDSDDASVTVNCYGLTVTKDAETSFSRDYDWDIAKTRFIAEGDDDGDGDPSTLTLDEGQTFLANYEVTVTMTGFTDSDWAVEGTITINNPAPIPADDVVVTDVISAGINATVDCGDGATMVDIPAESSVDCDYSSALPDASTRTNTATATLFGIDYDGSADVIFDLDNPTVEIDECIDVVDDAGTPADPSDDIDLGTVCVDDLDESNQWSDTYILSIGPFEVCGEYEFTNTVSFETTDDENDTDESGSAVYTVTIDVPCPEGCTLTQGYWKTHNDSFWGGAPTDETWDLIGPLAEKEIFFLSGQTYFDVMWTAPQGNVYYLLAGQYIAAVLNGLDGADTSAVTDELADAEALFETYAPDYVATLKGKNGKELRAQFVELAGTLANYNEGLIGPGHCDEDGSSA